MAEGKRKTTAERYAARRAELKSITRRPSSTNSERLAALAELRKQPRNASATRARNRNSVDGRPRGYLRKFASPGSAPASRHTPDFFRE